MNQVQRKAQQSQGDLDSHGRSEASMNDTSLSRHDQSLASENSPKDGTQVFHSQAPSHNLSDVHAPKENLNKSRVSLGGSTELLAFYANPKSIQSNPNSNKIQVAHQSLPGEGDPMDTTSADKAKANPSSVSVVINKPARSSRERHASPAERLTSNAVDTGPTTTTERGHEQQASKKRQRDSAGTESHMTRDKDLRSNDSRPMRPPSPSKKRRRTDAEETILVDSTGAEKSPPNIAPSTSGGPGVGNKTVPADVLVINHWEGMTAIPASEVEIPKDQMELLEQLKWYPQEPGVSAPLCHVPPHLLSQWNDIARNRHRRTKKLDEPQFEEIPDRAPTPTQGTTLSTIESASESEELPWSGSSRGGSPLNALPEDTPPRQIVAGNETPTLTATQGSASQIEPKKEVDMESGSQDSLPNARPIIVGSADASNPTAKVISTPRSKAPTKPTKVCSPKHSAGGISSPKLNVSMPLSGGLHAQPSTPIRQSPRHQSNLGDTIATSGSQDKPMIDESDESDDSDDDMEASVPFALGQSVPLSSQPQHHPTSSGPSLPGMAEASIQVAETPVVGSAHLRNKQNQQASSDLPGSQQLQSEDHKTSSASRIRNTYCSQESHRQTDSSNEAKDPSLLGDDNNSPQVGGLGSQTQASGSRVLDPSKPTRRQRGSSIFHLEPSDDPPFPSASPLLPAISRPNEAAGHSKKSQSKPESASKTLQSPVKAHMAVSRGGKAHTDSPDVEIVTRRQSYLGQVDRSAEAQRIYENFCSAYPPYSGDFSHFVKMCSRLHAMREKGLLKRSFLWDDFVIINLEHPERSSPQASNAMSYEDYFCSICLVPQYKKRSLTASGIDVAASQQIANPIASPETVHSPSRPTSKLKGKQNPSLGDEAVNVSFTASLVDKFSDLHARSFGHTNNDHALTPLLQSTATRSSSTSSNDTEPDTRFIKKEDDNEHDAGFPAELIPSHSSHPTMDGEVADSTQASTDSAHSAPQNAPAKVESDLDDLDETQQADDSHHRTASIELGDDTHDHNIPVSSDMVPVAASANDSPANSPSKQKRSTWFSSLQTLFPPKGISPANPPWSHDPNTPFKRWARQDQNVLQEINRRGGTKVLLDEAGIICRPTYNRAPRDSQ